MRETWERLYGAEGDLIDRLVFYQDGDQLCHCKTSMMLICVKARHTQPHAADCVWALQVLRLDCLLGLPCSAHGQLGSPLIRELTFFARLSNAHDVEKVANAGKAVMQTPAGSAGRAGLHLTALMTGWRLTNYTFNYTLA